MTGNPLDIPVVMGVPRLVPEDEAGLLSQAKSILNAIESTLAKTKEKIITLQNTITELESIESRSQLQEEDLQKAKKRLVILQESIVVLDDE